MWSYVKWRRSQMFWKASLELKGAICWTLHWIQFVFLYTSMHVHTLWMCQCINTDKHTQASLVLNDPWHGTYTRWTWWTLQSVKKFNIKNCTIAIILPVRIFKKMNVSFGLSATVGVGLPSERLELHSVWPRPTNTSSIWRKIRRRRHKAIKSQIKILSTCCPIRWSDLSMNEEISKPVNQFSTSWLLPTSLPKPNQ